MGDQEHRKALGDFLRQKRANLTPEEVGLPPGTRRRTPGLRREEVAQLANIGLSWYMRLEQGHDVRPSAQVLESLARVLRLTPNERRHLFMLAGQSLPPRYEETVSPVLNKVLDSLCPSPAFAVGLRWDFLAWNKAAEIVFAISEGKPPHERNLIWRLFTIPQSKALFPNWEQLAKAIIAELHTARARFQDDADFERLIADLKRESEDFRRLWPRHEAPRSLDGYKMMKHEVLGHLEFDHITLLVPDHPDLRVMIYSPDADTKTKLETYLNTGKAHQEIARRRSGTRTNSK